MPSEVAHQHLLFQSQFHCAALMPSHPSAAACEGLDLLSSPSHILRVGFPVISPSGPVPLWCPSEVQGQLTPLYYPMVNSSNCFRCQGARRQEACHPSSWPHTATSQQEIVGPAPVLSPLGPAYLCPLHQGQAYYATQMSHRTHSTNYFLMIC